MSGLFIGTFKSAWKWLTSAREYYGHAIYEYFIKLGSNTLRVKNTRQVTSGPEVLGEVTSQLHFDFVARAKYVSIYIEDMPDVSCPEALVLRDLASMMKELTEGVHVAAGFKDEVTNIEDLVFTGQVYIFSERPVSDRMKSNLTQEVRGMGYTLTFRSTEFVTERNRFERPQAFICHDARDKERIAQPLALALQRRLCTVWFDEFTLKVGDSLRTEIEKGLRDCSKCIIILSHHFLSNEGWTKREYDSIFTREILDNKSIILPVWNEVSANDIYNYSPALADKVGVDWKLGEDEVARRLVQAIGNWI